MTTVPPNAASLRGAVDLSSLVNRPAPGSPAATGAAPAAGTPGAGGPITVPALVLEGTDANFGDILQLSSAVPVLVDLWAEWCGPCKQLTPILEKLVAEFNGRIILAKVDVDTNPQLAQAFRAQSIPTVAALVGGKPVELFTGAIPEEQVRQVLDQLLTLAAQQGVTGTAVVAGAVEGEEPVAPPEPELPPLHQEAHAAIDNGDYASAIASYKTAIAQDPRDDMAKAALAQVSLLHRLQGKSLDQIRSAAASDPANLDAQLDVADLDLSGGHVEDAFDRLLELYPAQDAEGKTRVRERLLELFEVVGAEAPQVAGARRRLTMLLY